MGRIGYSDAAHVRLEESRKLRRLRTGPIVDSQGYASEGVYLLGAGDDFGLIAQPVDEGLVGGEEDVDRSALLYLGGQTAAGPKDQGHPGAGPTLEGGGYVLESEPQTAGGADDQLILGGRTRRLARC